MKLAYSITNCHYSAYNGTVVIFSQDLFHIKMYNGGSSSASPISCACKQCLYQKGVKAMTEPEPTQEKELTVEELEEIDAGIRRKVYIFGRMLCDNYRLDHGVPKDDKKRALLLNMFASYSTARSVERQEVLMKDMRKESKRMTWLTWAVVILTAVVLVVAVLQVILLIIQICSN